MEISNDLIKKKKQLEQKISTKIIEHEIDSIPVVENLDGKTRVVGKISKTNITRLFLEIVDN